MKTTIYHETLPINPPYKMETWRCGEIRAELLTHSDQFGDRLSIRRLSREFVITLIKEFTRTDFKDIGEPREWWQPFLYELREVDNVWYYKVAQEWLD